MAGLLGDSFDDPKTMAVMQMAAGLLGGGNFGQALGRGLGGYQQTMSAAKEQALLDEQMQWKRDERKQKEEAQQRQQNLQRLIQSQFSPVSGSQAIGMDASGPTLEKAAMIGQRKPVDFQALIAAGATPEMVKALAEAPNLGRAKVARTVKGIGPDGREYEYQFDEFGQKVGDGMAQFRAPLMQDLGGQVAALDPYSLKPMAQFGKTMTPDGKASNAVAWANNANARQRLAFDMAGGAEAVNGGKPQFNADTGSFIYQPSRANPQGAMVPLPGFQKPLNDVQGKALLFGTRMQEADKVMTDLAEKGTKVPPLGTNAPLIGGLVNAVSSESNQMLNQAQRDFINAVLRRESGAAIADSEFESAAKQYFPQIGEGPKVAEQKARARQLAIQGILAEVPSTAKPIAVPDKPNPSGKPPPMLGQVVNGWKFKGGNPADRSNWEKQ